MNVLWLNERSIFSLYRSWELDSYKLVEAIIVGNLLKYILLCVSVYLRVPYNNERNRLGVLLVFEHASSVPGKNQLVMEFPRMLRLGIAPYHSSF